MELITVSNNGGYGIGGITETWLGYEDGDEYNIEEYKLFRKDRPSKRGGVLEVG